MWRRLLACLLCLASSAGVAHAQAAASPPDDSGSALPWALAAVFTLVILLIVCVPSRKAQT